MIIFLIIFILLSFGATVLKFSMIEKRRDLYLAIALLPLFSLLTYRLSLNLNNASFLAFFQDKDTISRLSFLQIVESVLMILVAITLIKGHFKKGSKVLSLLFSIIPSFMLFGGIFFLQLYAFLNIQGYSYLFIAIAFALGVCMATVISLWLVKLLFSDWDVRAELKILMALFQILLAMFLPIIVNEIKVPYSNLEVDLPSVYVLIVVVLSTMTVGWLLNRYKNKLKLKLWSK